MNIKNILKTKDNLADFQYFTKENKDLFLKIAKKNASKKMFNNYIDHAFYNFLRDKPLFQGIDKIRTEKWYRDSFIEIRYSKFFLFLFEEAKKEGATFREREKELVFSEIIIEKDSSFSSHY